MAPLPVIPAVSCPPAAAALGGAGVGTACQAAAGLSSTVGAAASQLAGLGIGSALDAIAGWVSDGAAWLLGEIGSVLSSTTSIDLGASWFTDHYRTMAALAGVVVLPMLLAGVIQAIHRQSASMLVRSALVNVPLAILLTAVAVKLVQLGLAVTDAMSSAVSQGSGVDTGHAFDAVIKVLGAGQAAGGPSTPTFVVLLGSLAVVVGAFLLWVELLVRAAAVYVAVLFLPLALASLAWPAVAHWSRRLVDTLAALVLGKFVIVAVLSLGVAALAAGTGGSGADGGFTDVLTAAALLALAAASPWALFRLLPFLEAGAVGHLEGAGRRTVASAVGPVRSLADTAVRLSAAGGSGGASEVGMALASGAASGGPPGPGGHTPGAGVGPTQGGRPGGPGDAPHRQATPDLGPSSLESTGVGTPSAPGAGIPAYPSDPEAGEAFRPWLAGYGIGLDGAPLEPPGGADPPAVARALAGGSGTGGDRTPDTGGGRDA